ncbi:MAG: DUF11 domain-containing protein [Anaerolineae bacterium]|nr:DUF11 domain-containing protein [Anaerolineae bacterium]
MKSLSFVRLLAILILCTILVPAGAILASGVAAPPTAAPTEEPLVAVPLEGEPPAPGVANDAKTPLAPQARTAPLIIDNLDTDITIVPQQYIEAAKQQLHIGYGHTSHGSQISSGMNGLVDFANNGGLGLALPEDIFMTSSSGNQGGTRLHFYEGDGYGDGDLDHDVGYYPDWVEETHAYLGAVDGNGRGNNHPEINVIMWSWCGQASGRTEETMRTTYLEPMTALEAEYPGITFVYMTGHSDGSGEEGNLHLRNQQIRDYVIANNKVLFDFYRIELYDPDGNYYGDKAVNDECYYDSDGNGSRDRNWASDWQEAHTEGVDWYSCSCAHSQSLNCNRKAYAIWALWASLAGWNGGSSAVMASKTASQDMATIGETVAYTVVLEASGTPPTGTASIHDTIPTGLSYVPGSLEANIGTANDDNAPDLSWSGVLTPTPVVTLTYAAIVDVAESMEAVNSAVFEIEGLAPMTRTATVQIMRPADYPNLTPSFKRTSTTVAGLGETVVFTVGVRNATGPIDVSAFMTDTLPQGLEYVAGSLAATAGMVDASHLPALYWTGVLSPDAEIDITYSAVVTNVVNGTTIILPPRLINNAIISAGDRTVTRSAHISTSETKTYLPLVLKQTS